MRMFSGIGQAVCTLVFETAVERGRPYPSYLSPYS